MTKIQDVHPTVCHGMDMAVQLLKNVITLRQREIADMEQAIQACLLVRADEAQTPQIQTVEDIAVLDKKLETAVATELEKTPTIAGAAAAATRKNISAFRQAARDGELHGAG